ncbi:MAG: hypothetical protein EZS28_005816 [Streblomastix strix]|uniref:Uncharacterized protein n=1 Tax=Streblomastix strix TaxID=222440 RepID=A0A5J4WV29_9EUKA|nr:MAG: hypothetical protein EZS28_005816 [Streblomastix strix]
MNEEDSETSKVNYQKCKKTIEDDELIEQVKILYVSYDSFLKTSNQKELQIVSRCTEFLSLNSILLLGMGSLLYGNTFSFA